MPPFPPKNDVRGCRAVTDLPWEGEPGCQENQPRRMCCSGPFEALQGVPAGGEDRESPIEWRYLPGAESNIRRLSGWGANCPALGHSAAIGFRTPNTSEVDSISPSQYLISASRLRSTQRGRSASSCASR